MRRTFLTLLVLTLAACGGTELAGKQSYRPPAPKAAKAVPAQPTTTTVATTTTTAMTTTTAVPPEPEPEPAPVVAPAPPPPPTPPPPSALEVCETVIGSVSLPAGWGRECVEQITHNGGTVVADGWTDPARRVISVRAGASMSPPDYLYLARHEAGHAYSADFLSDEDWRAWEAERGCEPGQPVAAGGWCQGVPVAEDVADCYACGLGSCDMAYRTSSPTAANLDLLRSLLAG